MHKYDVASNFIYTYFYIEKQYLVMLELGSCPIEMKGQSLVLPTCEKAGHYLCIPGGMVTEFVKRHPYERGQGIADSYWNGHPAQGDLWGSPDWGRDVLYPTSDSLNSQMMRVWQRQSCSRRSSSSKSKDNLPVIISRRSSLTCEAGLSPYRLEKFPKAFITLPSRKCYNKEYYYCEQINN
jgi:hypothetical protein